MATTNKRVTVLHAAAVSPSENAAELRLYLTFFDVVWVAFHPIQRLLFFNHPISSSEFMETVVPRLKTSLSKTLSHYLPLAGNMIQPFNLDTPELIYSPGDSISISFFEADESLDFNRLTGNQTRDADEFYNFVPDLPTGSEEGFQKTAVLAIQVTLFPETGICIGFTNHHAVGDASSIAGFIKAWSTESKLGRNQFQDPIFDRSLVIDPSLRRANIFWNHIKSFYFHAPLPKLPTNRTRATFVLQKSHIQILKDKALSRNPSTQHLSSFTVTLGYSWATWVKSGAQSGEIVDENEPEYFGFSVDCRNRVDPPIPETYFGNCLAFLVVESTHGKLKSEDGFFEAVDLIGECIREKANKKGEILKEADEWLVKLGPLLAKRSFGVAGSPRFDLYEADFGWGKAKKFEAVSIDGDQGISLSKSPVFDGGLEIGLSAPVKKIEAFANFFHGSLIA